MTTKLVHSSHLELQLKLNFLSNYLFRPKITLGWTHASEQNAKL
jgi:hypothetical protein